MGMPQEATTEDRNIQPGQMIPGKGIFIGEFDLFDSDGERLGIRTRWYDAAVELGKPMTFNATADAVFNCDANGRGGLRLDPARYEAELFEKLKTGEAMGKNVIAPLEVVKTIYALRNQGEYKRLNDRNLPGNLITVTRGGGDAHCQWSCKEYGEYSVRTVDFTDGNDDCFFRDGRRISGRACFAELAP